MAGAGVALDEAPGFREALRPRPPERSPTILVCLGAADSCRQRGAFAVRWRCRGANDTRLSSGGRILTQTRVVCDPAEDSLGKRESFVVRRRIPVANETRLSSGGRFLRRTSKLRKELQKCAFSLRCWPLVEVLPNQQKPPHPNPLPRRRGERGQDKPTVKTCAPASRHSFPVTSSGTQHGRESDSQETE